MGSVHPFRGDPPCVGVARFWMRRTSMARRDIKWGPSSRLLDSRPWSHLGMDFMCIYIYNYYNVCIYRWLYMYTCIEYVIKFTNNLLWVCLKKWERLPKNAYEMLGKWGFTIMFSFVPGFQTWMDLQSFHPTWQWKIRFVNVEVFNWKNSYG